MQKFRFSRRQRSYDPVKPGESLPGVTPQPRRQRSYDPVKRIDNCHCCGLDILYPANGQKIRSLTEIRGTALPCAFVSIFMDNLPPLQTIADCSGSFQIENPYTLAEGPHTLYAISCLCGRCHCITSHFTIETSAFLIEPIAIRMGESFRTIDIDVLVSGASGTATVFYLLLPPGSPAPSVSKILNYNDTASLLNGTAAKGQFNVVLTPQQTLYTWTLTGLDAPNLPTGTTGIIDGYRYDAYIYVVLSPSIDSGVLGFGSSALGMPFDRGKGTPDNPFLIRNLSPSELQMYPDLLANNPLNRPGVDENARMLENIERLTVLSEETNGVYGISDSLALNYLMTSDIDLAGYATAYNGNGWLPIGDVDSAINGDIPDEHHFSGIFDGGQFTISNLSITPTAAPNYFVGYRGLFGAVEEGTIQNLRLSSVTINAIGTAPGEVTFGSFVAISLSPVLTNLTLTGATIFIDVPDDSPIFNREVNAGGFVGSIFLGAEVNGITGQNISISVPPDSALSLGGFVGYTDKFEGTENYNDIQLSTLNINGYAMLGGLCGSMYYGANKLQNITINNIILNGLGGLTGGLVGSYQVYSGSGDAIIANNNVQNIVTNTSGQNLAHTCGDVGGLIGRLRENPFVTLNSAGQKHFGLSAPEPTVTAVWPRIAIQLCSVTGGNIAGNYECGGLVGFIFIDRPQAAQSTSVSRCKARIPVSAATTNAGGLIGFYEGGSVSECFSTGTVNALASPAASLIGTAVSCFIVNSYATGAVTGTTVVGGCSGLIDNTDIGFCYNSGNITGVVYAGGISASANLSTIHDNLVLGGTISASVSHRILGVNDAGSTLSNNYALDTTVLIPGPVVINPNGEDGGTISSAQIISTMQSLGWNTTTVWNTATIPSLGRPTLLNNPE